VDSTQGPRPLERAQVGPQGHLAHPEQFGGVRDAQEALLGDECGEARASGVRGRLGAPIPADALARSADVTLRGLVTRHLALLVDANRSDDTDLSIAFDTEGALSIS
jgi:hypothetical protein